MTKIEKIQEQNMFLCQFYIYCANSQKNRAASKLFFNKSRAPLKIAIFTIWGKIRVVCSEE